MAAQDACVFCDLDQGGRSAVKAPENRRPDPTARGGGRARLFGPRS